MKTKSLRTKLSHAVMGVYLSTTLTLIIKPAQAQIQTFGPRHPEPTPEQRTRLEQQGHMCHDAAVALHAGAYVQAETDARQALALGEFSGVGQEVLAGALDGQGKTQEALQEYTKRIKQGGRVPRNLLPYALLLLKTGQWMQAVDAYNEALPHFADDKKLMQANSRFSPDAPDSAGLATAIHIARGLTYNAAADFAHEDQSDLALFEYKKALEVAPDSALANYYYGIGLRKLGMNTQARVAFQKAASLATGDVKAAAQEAAR